MTGLAGGTLLLGGLGPGPPAPLKSGPAWARNSSDRPCQHISLPCRKQRALPLHWPHGRLHLT